MRPNSSEEAPSCEIISIDLTPRDSKAPVPSKLLFSGPPTYAAATSSNHVTENPLSMSSSGPPDSEHVQFAGRNNEGDFVIHRPQITGATRDDSMLEVTEKDGRSEPVQDFARQLFHTFSPSNDRTEQDRNPVNMHVHFAEFAAQLRSQRHQEHKRRMLEHRRDRLQEAVALSRRLQRVGSWIHDGLTEVFRHADASAFMRGYQRMQELTDSCFSHWDHEIQAMDPINLSKIPSKRPEDFSFFAKLSLSSQDSCLELVQNVRSNPLFLIDRFKLVSISQLATLSTPPKFLDVTEPVHTSLSRSHAKKSQKRRVESYAKGLEDYATSLERSNPLSFLLFNCYGSQCEISSKEDQLRLSTWSTICSGLMQESPPAFDVLRTSVLNGFSILYGWSLRNRFELYLMDVLQRGSFLLEVLNDYTLHEIQRSALSDTMNTEQAQEFFDHAIRDLFALLCTNDGGFPLGALALGQSILGQLSSVEAQSNFRRDFFFKWFIEEFLRICIVFPENENMLLQYHINEGARSHILQQLYERAYHKAVNAVSSESMEQLDAEIEISINSMIGQLIPSVTRTEPYSQKHGTSTETAEAGEDIEPHDLIICAADIVYTLDGMSPQSVYGFNTRTSDQLEDFMRFSQATFSSRYAPAANRFDQLRRELLSNTEPGHSSTHQHPLQETWLRFCISGDGTPFIPKSGPPQSRDSLGQNTDRFGSLDSVQRAAIRLVEEGYVEDIVLPPISTHTSGQSLAQLILVKSRSCYKSADILNAHYWERVYKDMVRSYHLAIMTGNESIIFQPLILMLKQSLSNNSTAIQILEQQVGELQDEYTGTKTNLAACTCHLSSLRTKMWYSTDVVNSKEYEDARRITRALNHMVLPLVEHSEFGQSLLWDAARSGTSTSTSSLFEQPIRDIMSILKAPSKHGGPRKLADDQIEMIKKWLDRNNIENFCKGEERIHRFSIEIKTAIKKLAGETPSETPVLWSSRLWQREKAAFGLITNVPFESTYGSSRPPSVMSETFLSSFNNIRPTLRNQERSQSARSLDSDIFRHSSTSMRINKDFFLIEPLNPVASPDPSSIGTVAESVSSFWSHPTAQTKSLTSESVQSRPASISGDFSGLRLENLNYGKNKFIEELQQELTCLLLSDLGNPVWSCGSETDAWVNIASKNAGLRKKMNRHKVLSQLRTKTSVAKPKSDRSEEGFSLRRGRSYSMDNVAQMNDYSGATESFNLPSDERLPLNKLEDRMAIMSNFQDLLDKISHQVDPNMKLQTVQEFTQLAVISYDRCFEQLDSIHRYARSSMPTSLLRSKSLSSVSILTMTKDQDLAQIKQDEQLFANSDIKDDPVERLGNILMALCPKTLFRDLQYIATFATPEKLNKPDARQGFLQLGIAALAYKDEFCRNMTNLACKMVVDESQNPGFVGENSMQRAITKAREYWVLAAREGNAIAQRELAGLYLTHPRVPPIVTLPLSLSAEVFQEDVTWDPNRGQGTNTQALQLALHWMQAAADNGDFVAQQRLQEWRTPSTT